MPRITKNKPQRRCPTSPPFGYLLFYLKSVAPPQVSMATIIRGAVAFLCPQGAGVALCILFPGLVLWLPRLFYGTS
jgi:TRAP-type mannitol/chloroaromatic compound transport system permease large subunit